MIRYPSTIMVLILFNELLNEFLDGVIAHSIVVVFFPFLVGACGASLQHVFHDNCSLV